MAQRTEEGLNKRMAQPSPYNLGDSTALFNEACLTDYAKALPFQLVRSLQRRLLNPTAEKL